MGYEDFVNFNLLFAIFAVILPVTLYLFRKAITSFVDPLLPFAVWASSVLGAAIYVVIFQPDRSSASFFLNFAFSMTCLIIVLAYLLRSGTRRKSYSSSQLTLQHNRAHRITVGDWALFGTLLLVNSIILALSYKEIFAAGLESSFAARFFLAEEFRHPLVKIINIVGRPLFFAQASRILLLSANRRHRILVLISLIASALAMFMLGSRSVLLLIAGIFGSAIILYRKVVSIPQWARDPFKFVIFIGLFIVTMAVATAGYFRLSLAESFSAIFQRVLLAADGVFIWVFWNMDVVFHPSITTTLNYIFGQFFGTLEKNFGWQLYEAFIGQSSAVAAGPNFIFPFQIYLAGVFAPLWFTVSVLVALFLRRLRPSHNTLDSCKIVAISYAFGHFIDPEYSAFVFAFLTVFFFGLFFIRRLTLVALKQTNLPQEITT